MAARLGQVLYWIACIIAALIVAFTALGVGVISIAVAPFVWVIGKVIHLVREGVSESGSGNDKDAPAP